MSQNYPEKTKSTKVKHILRLTFEDFKEMDKLLRKNERAKIVIVKNKSGIHIDFRSYKHKFNT